MYKFFLNWMLLVSLAAWAQGPAKTSASLMGKTASPIALHGWVVDEVCARVTGRTSEHASCARMCSRMHHKELVFVSDYNGLNIKVKNPNKLRPYMGKHLDIEARLLAPKKIEVLHVDPASANAPPNDPIAAHDVLVLPPGVKALPKLP
jgi:hypothetical protein